MADSYTVLARRYRSQNFDELVGQEAIAQTLKNAITSGRVAHAFLFTGTRGVGKTSSARILAKALNCPNTKDGQPCGVCETCKAIARGEDMDVIEIDGASNNGVDQVRELRQNAGIRPARSPYKIYIIDEVHMLSLGAFNALLKTLEEPPEHVKFIFATTDVHKVPPTILSRVQRFDFKNIPTQRIADHLAGVCKQEQVEADPDALHRIARLGNGSMRDALSLLDRVLSLGEKHITEKLLEELLGKPPTAALAELVDAIAAGDAGAALTRSDDLLKSGMGAEQVLSELIEFFRNLMLVAACGPQTDLLEVTADLRPRFVELAAKFDAPTLVHLIALTEQTLRNLKGSTMGRALFDALVVRLSMSEQFSSLRDLLRGGGGTAAKSHDPAPGSAVTAGQKKNELTVPPPAAPQASQVVSPAPVSPAAAPHSGRPSFRDLAAAHPPAAVPSPAMPADPSPVVAPAEPAAPLDPHNLPAVWDAVRRHLVESKNGSININLGPTSRLEHLDPSTGEAILAIPQHMKGYAGERVRLKIEEAIKAVLNRPVRLTLRPSDALAPTAAPQNGPGGHSAPGMPAGRPYIAPPSPAVQRVPPELEEAVRNQPLVRHLIETLGGDVKMIEILESATASDAASEPSDTPS